MNHHEPLSPEFIGIKIAELRAFAAEYHHYATRMPTDPFATRWHIIAEALTYQADGLEAQHLMQPTLGADSAVV
jgi:hypothetical protein